MHVASAASFRRGCEAARRCAATACESELALFRSNRRLARSAHDPGSTCRCGSSPRARKCVCRFTLLLTILHSFCHPDVHPRISSLNSDCGQSLFPRSDHRCVLRLMIASGSMSYLSMSGHATPHTYRQSYGITIRCSRPIQNICLSRVFIVQCIPVRVPLLPFR